MITTKTLDKIGFVASSACAVHCAIMPLMIASLSVYGLSWLSGSTFGISMMVFTFVIATLAIFKGFRKHKNCWPIGWLGFGILALVTSEVFLCGGLHTHAIKLGPRMVETICMHPPHPLHHYLSATGGFVLAFAHFLNRKLCKKCECCVH